MNNLTLEHLAPYLPYRLKIYYEPYAIKYYLSSVGEWNIELLHPDTGMEYVKYDSEEFGNHKPILRPMSDLTKEIQVDGWMEGKPFKPIDFIDMHHNFSHLSLVDIEKDPTRYPYTVVRWLTSLHFDIHGLIDKNLAVNLNTLKQ